MQSGKLRYPSSEVTSEGSEYHIGNDYLSNVLLGVAFVDDPAVKGMNWTAVINAMEFSGLTAVAPNPVAGATAATEQGGDNMSILEMLKTLKAKAKVTGLTEADLDGIEQLAQEDDTPTAPVATSPTVQSLELEKDPRWIQMQESRKEDQARIEQLESGRRQDQAVGIVDSLVREGVVPPAQRQQLFVLANHLLSETTPLGILETDAEGKPVEVKRLPVDILRTLLKDRSSILEVTPGQLWTGRDAPEPTPEETLQAGRAAGAALQAQMDGPVALLEAVAKTEVEVAAKTRKK